jgi:phosphohistidine phosphatase
MSMDLILWRHAEAEDLEETDEGGGADLSRRLTAKGERQASRMAAWLDRQLPEGVKVYCSPAVRTEQTVIALGRKYKARDELLPDATVDDLLALAQWPHGRQPVLVVGHQPTLGRTIARLLGLREAECSVRKGSVWWLRQRERHGQWQTVILTVQTPELL